MTTKMKNSTPDPLVEHEKQVILRKFRQIPGVGKSIKEIEYCTKQFLGRMKNYGPQQ